MLGHPELPEPLIKLAVAVLSAMSPNERDLIRIVVEVINELRDPYNESQIDEQTEHVAFRRKDGRRGGRDMAAEPTYCIDGGRASYSSGVTRLEAMLGRVLARGLEAWFAEDCWRVKGRERSVDGRGTNEEA